MVREILLLGDKSLYNKSAEIGYNELNSISEVIRDLHDTLTDFRKRHGLGRAIAAPQIGVFKRLIYMNIDPMLKLSEGVAFINPRLEFPTDEKMLVLDDCMSVPGLFVNVYRYKECVIHYKDNKWIDQKMILKDDISELLQHEYDHLDGILATMRAIDNKSFVLRVK
jgi:peptide deformylase